MCTPSISFDEVHYIMNKWITQYTEEWTNAGDRWCYESDAGIFEWYKYSQDQKSPVNIGARLANQGSTIIIWTGESDNDNIIINESGLVLNEHSDFDQQFDHGKMYDLFMKLKYRDNSEEAEKITNECLEKESNYTGIDINQVPGIKLKQKFDLDYFEMYKAYEIVDRLKASSTHGLLISLDEDELIFNTYNNVGQRTDVCVDINDYLERKYDIKPLIVKEQ